MKYQWIEPGKYKRSRFKSYAVKDMLGYAGIVFVVLVVLRFVAGLRPSPDSHPPEWPLFLAVTAPGSLVLAFVWPTLMRFLSVSHVIVSEKGVNNNLQVGTSVRIRFWSWDKIESVQVGEDRSTGESQRVINLLGPGGVLLETFGLGDKANVATIEAAVEANGKRFEGAG